MRNSVAVRCSLCFVLLMAAGLSWAEDQPFELEPWEVRLNERQPPLEIMAAIGVEPGMVIAEIGAGTGRMTIWLASRVGTDGHVYANDIDTDSLDQLARRCEREGLENVETIVGETEDPLLPAEALDMVFMINVYHHADDAVALVRNALPSLKPDGVLAIVECDPEKVDWGAEEGCTGKAGMFAELDEAGYEDVRVKDEAFLAEDNIYLARPRLDRSSPDSP